MRVDCFEKQVRAMDMQTPDEHPSRKYVDLLVKSCAEMMEKHKVATVDNTDKLDEPTYKNIVKLHKKALSAIRRCKKAE